MYLAITDFKPMNTANEHDHLLCSIYNAQETKLSAYPGEHRQHQWYAHILVQFSKCTTLISTRKHVKCGFHDTTSLI